MTAFHYNSSVYERVRTRAQNWLFLSASLLVLSACASSPLNASTPDYREGLGPDLRVFSDSSCIGREVSTKGAESLVWDIVRGVTSAGLKSVGRYLEEAGSAEVETASAIHPILFLGENAAQGGPLSINPEVRCLHIVRDGYQKLGFADDLPENLKKSWVESFGLTGTPSVYALIRFDPAPDGSSYFKGTLQEFRVDRFARPGAEAAKRDFVIIVELVAPNTGRQYRLTRKGEVIFEPAGPIGRGWIPLPGVQQHAALSAPKTRGLETGWISAPVAPSDASRQPVNMYVDVVEMKRGNPFLAEIGRFLQDPEFNTAVNDELSTLETRDETARVTAAEQTLATQASINNQIDQQRTERRLIRSLIDRTSDLNSLLNSGTKSSVSALAAKRALEDALFEIDAHHRLQGWTDNWPPPESAAASLALNEYAKLYQ